MKIVIAIMSMFVFLFADKVFTGEAKQRSMTIYNGDIAFIQETKDFTLKKDGENFIVYEGVPNSIIVDSVVPSFSKKDTFLYSQTFELNKVDIKRLISYYKKRDLPVKFFKPTKHKDERVISKGYILSDMSNNITIKDENAEIYLISYKDIIFPKLPKELSLTKPSLTWRAKGIKGKQNIKLSYLTKGISWIANYTLNLNKSAKLNGWITITNRSGISYKGVKIYCVAGSVNLVRNVIYRRKNILLKSMSVASNVPRVRQESFGGYHLYAIPFKEDVQKGSKEIKFLSKKDVLYDEYAKLDLTIPSYLLRGEKKYDLFHIIHLKNVKQSGLGIALPKGKIRVFKKDSQNQIHFLGESSISHTPIKSDINLNIGKFFDIKAHIKQISFKSTKNRDYLYSKINVKVSNQDKTTRVIKIKGFYEAYGNYTIKSTCSGICKEKKVSIGVQQYQITLKPKTSYNFYITYEINNQ